MKYVPRLDIYFTVWKTLAITEFQQAFVNRATNAMFILGKLLRLGMALTFLLVIKNTITTFAGYTSDQVVVFYLTYQLIDVLGQTFYRGVYLFSEKVRSGEFDFSLVKPLSSLFLSLVGKPDINDAFFLIPNLAVSFYLLSTLNITFSVASVLLYLVLLINSFLLVTALHIIVLVVGIITTEVDGVIWMYRDLVALGRFPVTIYGEPLRTALFFLVPAGVMITIPAEVLLGLTPSYSILVSCIVGVTVFLISLRLWKWSLQFYSSASS
jgi:ABC-2 type transport system permease protein